ncbi:hypothetical protein Vau01_024660 [Virgisporangium aurantiacum]|uniref:Peptidase S8/S53 domain-containing protein n=1 Tax=Virgisporangium aurantiacum TaxID=175570 RepID=A0A8J3Z4S8_9ACTN|nr:hypothetical protein Vau01_024660 [Virgisporangium aurantiacum]
MLTAGLLTADPLTPTAAHADPPPVRGTDTAESLVAHFAEGPAYVDKSAVTACAVTDPVSGEPPQAVAYRLDRIAIRTWLDEPDVRTRLRSALDANGGAGIGIDTIGKVEFPDLTADHTVQPVWYAELEHAAPAALIRTARALWTPPLMTAAPVYLMAPNGGDTDGGPLESWPNGPPEPTTVLPPDRADAIGAGTTIAVYDMGMPVRERGNWPPNVTRLDGSDVEIVDAEAPALVADRIWNGHSVAIADVLNTVAPGASVEAVRITEPSGVPTEESATRRMASTLSRAHDLTRSPDLAVAAFGTPGCAIDPLNPTRGDLVPLGLQMVADAVDHYRETLIVASAGNRNTSRRYYPAAFGHESVLSVGALDTTEGAENGGWTSRSRSGRRADFSNFGTWVEAWAPGVDLSTRHLIGVSFAVDTDPVMGQALVDGTSYAGPYVAALFAQYLAANPGTPAYRAWPDIAAAGAKCSSAVGGGVAVTLTTLDAKPNTPPDPGLPPMC